MGNAERMNRCPSFPRNENKLPSRDVSRVSRQTGLARFTKGVRSHWCWTTGNGCKSQDTLSTFLFTVSIFFINLVEFFFFMWWLQGSDRNLGLQKRNERIRMPRRCSWNHGQLRSMNGDSHIATPGKPSRRGVLFYWKEKLPGFQSGCVAGSSSSSSLYCIAVGIANARSFYSFYWGRMLHWFISRVQLFSTNIYYLFSALRRYFFLNWYS